MMIETSPHDLPAQRSPSELNGDEAGSIQSARALAKGVLDQAATDLRKFRASSDPLGRELHLDAYSWVISNDLSWPYSFVNVCEVLGFSTEVVRAELLTDAESGWYSHSQLVARRLSASLRSSLTSLFRRGGLEGTETRANALTFPLLKSAPAGGTIQLRNS
jgi:hypothetical protein